MTTNPDLPFNVYDVAFHMRRGDAHSLSQLRPYASTRLFGNANIGNTMLCNLWQPQTFPHGTDMHAFVTGWYARTTLPPSDVLTEWAHATRCVFRVGEFPLAVFSMAELLARHERMSMPRDPETEAQAEHDFLRMVGRELWEAHKNKISGHGWSWEQLTDLEQEKWAGLAEIARAQFSAGRVFFVPARHWFVVEIESPTGATDRLTDMIKTHDQAALWMHLEGYERAGRGW